LKSSKIILGLLVLLCTTKHVQAEFSRGPNYKPSIGPSIYEQRKLYLDAIHYITSGQRNRYLKIRDSIRAYPLFPYLQYTDMAYRISKQKPADIAEFRNQYRDTPLANLLVRQYLHNKGERGQWSTFLQFYSPQVTSERNECFYAHALAKTGQEEAAMEQARRLWLVDHSQPDECDHIFYVWRISGHLNPEIAWKRYLMSIQANEISLANYLVRFLSDEDRVFATKLKLVHRKPHNIANTNKFYHQHPHNRDVILHGLARLSRSRPEIALDLLDKYRNQHAFKLSAVNNTYVTIAKRLAGKGDPEGKLDALPIELRAFPDLVESLIRLALRKSDFSQALVLINLLPNNLQMNSRWQFWKGRVLATSKDYDDKKAAELIFSDLSKQRSFYGFLSADILNQPYSFVNKPVVVSQEELRDMEETPGIKRALELFTIGERSRARREWYFSTQNFSDHEQITAARLALRWGWHKSAIQSMIAAEAWDDLNSRFPLAYSETFIQEARIADIPLNWSLAIARQESAFMPDARSSSGALGVMQLMPRTARGTAKALGIRYKSSSELTNPSLNIKLGSQYLGQMLRRFGNNRILASAAYNAGPSRVDSWINRAVPFDVWIETIPFSETRQYVQNVLMFSTIYSNQLAIEQPLIFGHEYDAFTDDRMANRKVPDYDHIP